MSSRRGFWFVIVILVGFGVGLYFAWMVYPIHIVDSTYHDLRQDYKTDYVLMVAEVYQKDRRRFDAIIRLDRLEEESTEAAILRAIENAEKLGYPDSDIDILYALNAAISGNAEDNLRPEDVYIDFNPLQATPTSTAEPAPILEIGGDPPVPAAATASPLPTGTAADPFGTDAEPQNPFQTGTDFFSVFPTGESFLTPLDAIPTPAGEPFDWN